MSREMSYDYLIIAPASGWDLAAARTALAWGNPGLLEVWEPPAEPLAVERSEVTLARLALHETLARVDLRITFRRSARPVLANQAPEALARQARGLGRADYATAQTGALGGFVHAVARDPDRAWCVRWLAERVALVARALGGVVADPASQRILTAERLGQQASATDALAFIVTHDEPWSPERRWLHTHGLCLFGQPELEIVAVPQALVAEGEALVRSVAAALVGQPDEDGPALRAGATVEYDRYASLLARPTATDARHESTTGRLRLVTAPAPGAAPGEHVTEALIAAAVAGVDAAREARDWLGAQRGLERVLAADPAHPAARAARARLALARGEPATALEEGAFIQATAPEDPHGPALAAQALLALGRPVEARALLDRAIARAPAVADLYEIRARALDRLALPAAARADRVHATTLRR